MPNTLPSIDETVQEAHDLYEKYAPLFGYATREDTKEFDPESPNGKLMKKVYSELLAARDTALLSQAIAVVAKERKEMWVFLHEAQRWDEQTTVARTLDGLIKQLRSLLPDEGEKKS